MIRSLLYENRLFKLLSFLLLFAAGTSTAACTAMINTADVRMDLLDDVQSQVETDISNFAKFITDEGLKFIPIAQGSGPKPKVGQFVQVHYTGKLLNGEQFDTSLNREPFAFQIGQREVIAGWEEGITMLSEGGSATLIIPPKLAYGAEGAGEGIVPPDATLVFTIDLLQIQDEAFEYGPVAVLPTEVEEDEFIATDSGLQYYDIQIGNGAAPRPGSIVSVHYTGWLAIDDTKFDSSFDRNSPITFALGKAQVIPGWEQGVSTMRVGGKRQLLIPSELAYEDAGFGELIPADATLRFDVELISILDRPPLAPIQARDDNYTVTESGLMYYDIEVGEGEFPETEDVVDVQYTGWLADGTIFDSSFSRGSPLSFTLNQDQVIPGWDEGVSTMRVGGKRQLLIPADLAYGAVGANDVVPPNADLIFEIELLYIKRSEGNSSR